MIKVLLLNLLLSNSFFSFQKNNDTLEINDINKINSLLENQTTQLDELLNYTYNSNSESNIKKDNIKITKDLPDELPKKEIDSKIKTNTTKP